MRINILQDRDTRDLAADIIGPDGHLRIMPCDYYLNTTQVERSLVAVKHGLYGLPTLELVQWLRDRIADRSALEIGAGNGVLANALGIHAADNFMQEEPGIKAYYQALGQTPVKYGANVERVDALTAVRKHRPQVVLACWVTHLFDEKQPHRGGNAAGVDEIAVTQQCEEYIFVGNRAVHGTKPLWDAPQITNEMFSLPGLYSRSMSSDANFVACFKRQNNNAE